MFGYGIVDLYLSLGSCLNLAADKRLVDPKSRTNIVCSEFNVVIMVMVLWIYYPADMFNLATYKEGNS